jgi:hypothetical protein
MVLACKSFHEDREREAALLSFHANDEILLLVLKFSNDEQASRNLNFFITDIIMIVFLNSVEEACHGKDEVANILRIVGAQENLIYIFNDKLRSKDMVNYNKVLLQLINLFLIEILKLLQPRSFFLRWVGLLCKFVENLLVVRLLGIIFVNVEAVDKEEAHEELGVEGTSCSQNERVIAIFSITGNVRTIKICS